MVAFYYVEIQKCSLTKTSIREKRRRLTSYKNYILQTSMPMLMSANFDRNGKRLTVKNWKLKTYMKYLQILTEKLNGILQKNAET